MFVVFSRVVMLPTDMPSLPLPQPWPTAIGKTLSRRAIHLQDQPEGLNDTAKHTTLYSYLQPCLLYRRLMWILGQFPLSISNKHQAQKARIVY